MKMEQIILCILAAYLALFISLTAEIVNLNKEVSVLQHGIDGAISAAMTP